MKLNLKGKHIVWILIPLFVAVALLAWLNASGQNFYADTVSVTSQGEVIHTFTLADIQALPKIEVQKTIHSSSSGEEEGVFSGVNLYDLLKAAGIDPSAGEYQTFTARATDGFSSQFSLDEALKKDNILVIYAKDGEALAGQDEGGAGPLRMLAVDDPFGNRCTKYLNEIEVR